MSNEEFAIKFVNRLAAIAEDQHQCAVKATITKKEATYEEKKNA